jgi:hypothetical protein
MKTKISTLSEERKEDLDALCSYIMEMEYDDVVTCLSGEPLYVEEGILTEEQADLLQGMSDEDQQALVDKCCENNAFRHVYALAWRLWKDVLA